jgi:hypothetical protein
MTIEVAEISPIGIGTAAATEKEKTTKRTITRRTAGSSKRAETARTEVLTAATVTIMASKNLKTTNQAASTP